MIRIKVPASMNFLHLLIKQCLLFKKIAAEKGINFLEISGFAVNFKCILFCTTSGYFLPFFSFLLNKREEENENEVAKPVLNPFFSMSGLKFTGFASLIKSIYTLNIFVQSLIGLEAGPYIFDNFIYFSNYCGIKISIMLCNDLLAENLIKSDIFKYKCFFNHVYLFTSM